MAVSQSALVAVWIAVRAPGLIELRADAQRGIERGERTLEDEAQRFSSQVAQIALAHGQQIGSLKSNFAFDCGSLAAKQTENGESQRAFARATLADQAEDFAFLNIE